VSTFLSTSEKLLSGNGFMIEQQPAITGDILR
jgi:hypothetical protein